MMRTRSGVLLEPHYSSADGQRERPGAFPFTRGRAAHAHATGTWIQRELSGEGDARQSNQQIHYLVDHGQTGIDVIGDSPTQAMMDPDHPLARAAVGTQGVSLCCKDDFAELFRGVPFDRVSVSSSVPPIIALAGLKLAARAAGFPIDRLRGSILQVPLYSEDCCYAIHLPVEFRVRMSLDAITYCAQAMPRFHSYVEDTYFFSESGLTPVEEMALGFVQIRHLTRRLVARGVPVDAFAPRIAILVNCGMEFFEEIAKIRATRRLFAKMMRDEFGATDPRSWSVAVTSHTSGLSLTAQQPANNIVRGTLQALSLVFAGVQALEISAFDEAFRTPSCEAHLVGLRTQQIIDLETGAARVSDPLGGSYFVEAMTDAIEARIRARVDEIEATGNPEQLSRDGYFKAIFHKAMEESQRLIDSGEIPVVGVNVHRIPDEDDILLRDVTERKIEPCEEQIERIVAFKRSRDLAQVTGVLDRVVAAVRSEANLVPVVTDALDVGATVGEITGTMRVGLGLAYDPYGLAEPMAA
jgi:methylmalonyl-CoA mutase N-terminal domain/subunit